MNPTEILQFVVAFATAAPALEGDAVAFFNALVTLIKGNSGVTAATLQATLDSVYNTTKSTLAEVEAN